MNDQGSDQVHQVQQIESRIASLSSDLARHLQRQMAKTSDGVRTATHAAHACTAAVTELGDRQRQMCAHVAAIVAMADEADARVSAARTLLADLTAINAQLRELDASLDCS
ncbi:hypothetical protein AYI69_g10228 [Smittium culicis]|uniref:Uncharacterized protein n=1 Tax=Smittium culicis TaxID=133412 RepID=A0A1R1X745_9FUNG|nr:hypothetical protein AYI69_g10228 [Smittium culicis]